jgi:monoamine oxidase
MVTPDDPVLLPVQCWPFGRDYVQGWIGGSIAWDLARQPDAAAVDYLKSYLRRIFGGRVDKVFAGGAAFLTRWHSNPWVRGAYSYAMPGAADARYHLGEAVAGGHLMFAGEACNVPYAGTVAGAWISGQHAARTVLEAI